MTLNHSGELKCVICLNLSLRSHEIVEMRLHRLLKCTVLFFISVMVISGCNSSEHALHVAIHKWPGYEFMFLANREGWIKKQDATLQETHSAKESLVLLQAGKVDAAALTLDEVLGAVLAGVDLRIVMVFDESAGADALYTRKKINSLKDLKGMRIGLEDSALGKLMLRLVLDKAGLNISDMTVINSSIDQHYKDWIANKFDALITYEPVSGKLDKLHAHRLIDSRRLPEIIFDVLAVRAEVLENHKNQVRNLIKAHFKALRHYQLYPQDATHRMARHLGVSSDEVNKSFYGLELLNEKNNRKYMMQDGKIDTAVSKISNILYANKKQIHSEMFKKLVTTRFLPVKGGK